MFICWCAFCRPSPLRRSSVSSKRTRQNGFGGNGVQASLGKPATEYSASANRASQRLRNTSLNKRNITKSIRFRRSSWRSSRRTTWNTTRDTFVTDFFRPAGACDFLFATHGSRRGLHSYAAPRLTCELVKEMQRRSERGKPRPSGAWTGHPRE